MHLKSDRYFYLNLAVYILLCGIILLGAIWRGNWKKPGTPFQTSYFYSITLKGQEAEVNARANYF